MFSEHRAATVDATASTGAGNDGVLASCTPRLRLFVGSTGLARYLLDRETREAGRPSPWPRVSAFIGAGHRSLMRWSWTSVRSDARWHLTEHPRRYSCDSGVQRCAWRKVWLRDELRGRCHRIAVYAELLGERDPSSSILSIFFFLIYPVPFLHDLFDRSINFFFIYLFACLFI